MRQGYTHIVVVLDKSGSMEKVADDTIGGFNAFLEEQRAKGGDATITLVLFDHTYQMVLDFVPLSEARPLTRQTYVPRGNTALLDAVGRTIDDLGKRLAAMAELDRPEKVVFAILTDGMENASSDYTYARVRQMVRHQTDVYKWEFIFLGVGIDAFAVGGSLGMQRETTFGFGAGARGTRSAFESMSRVVSSRRQAPTGGSGGTGGKGGDMVH